MLGNGYADMPLLYLIGRLLCIITWHLCGCALHWRMDMTNVTVHEYVLLGPFDMRGYSRTVGSVYVYEMLG